MNRYSILLLGLLLSACLDTTRLEPAPTDLDGNLRWFWSSSAAASEQEALDAVIKLNTASKAETRLKTTPNRGELSRLSTADLSSVMLDQLNEPAAAHGVFLLNVFDCPLDKLESSLLALNQKEQRPDAFDQYVREYTSDAERYWARTSPTLAWNVDVVVKLPFPIGETYRSALKGDVRRVSSSVGPVLIVRTWLTAPAVFQNGSTSTFRQDYQIEVYWQRSPGEIFHAYGIWREMHLASVDLGTEDPAYVNIMLDNLKTWDDQAAAICRK